MRHPHAIIFKYEALTYEKKSIVLNDSYPKVKRPSKGPESGLPAAITPVEQKGRHSTYQKGNE